MPTGHAERFMPTLRRVAMARQTATRTDGDLLGAFVLKADADAFAALVRRHGPMVLGVCRRVVGDHTTADDAFQAVFLVLARRAASVRPREQVANWLYGVAYRTALKARMVLARRRSREKQVDVMPEPIAPSVPAWSDVQAVIDEELAKLPDKLRLPVVLCDLEGRPQREVAKHLNVPPATLATRLASARRTLAARLTRRGVTLSGGALAGLLGSHASALAVPLALSAGVVRAVEAVAVGGAVNSLVSAHAIQLSEGVMRMMMLAKLKAVAVAAVTALVLTTGLGLGLVPAYGGDQPGTTPATKPAPQPAAQAKQQPQAEPLIDDATFLRRLSLDARGIVPTPLEMWLFVSDKDGKKRAKVAEWIVDDDAARAYIAQKLGIPLDRVRVVRAKFTPNGQRVVLTIEEKKPAANALAAEIVDYSAINQLAINQSLRVGESNSTWVYDALAANRVGSMHMLRRNIAAQPYVSAFPNVFWQPNNTNIIWEGADPDMRLSLAQASTTLWVVFADSDADFLNRVLADVRGNAPTALELKYFTEDKDPKKREKLIDMLLKDPAIQKKLGDEWKKKMLTPPATTYDSRPLYYVPLERQYLQLTFPQQSNESLLRMYNPNPLLWYVPATPATPQAAKPDKFEKLVGELIAAKKNDEAILEAITLATLSRLPTDSEKKLALAGISTAADRKAAWLAVARALRVETAPKPKP